MLNILNKFFIDPFFDFILSIKTIATETAFKIRLMAFQTITRVHSAPYVII